jgi:hypothetical protein
VDVLVRSAHADAVSRNGQEFFRAKVAGVALEELHDCIVTLRKLSGVPQSPVPNPLRKTDDAS